LLDTDGGLTFNNCAGAVLVMLAGLCQGREVIVARGELIEIGGGFRIPDVMKASGAKLVEVGTTNKVYASDYEAAITDETAAILSVHRSNFAIVGFTHQPTTAELAKIAKARGVPFLVDVGSGLLATDEELGEAAAAIGVEPRPKRLLAEGADLVAFSGDKLLGGPQAGLLAGRRTLLDAVKKHPLARALRADKLTIAALEATLALYRAGRAREIPTIRALATPLEEIATRADAIAASIRERIALRVDVVDGESVPGGGTLPLATLRSRLVLIGEPGEMGRALAAALRGQTPAIITRTVEDRTAIDARTVDPSDVSGLGPLVENACRRSGVLLEVPK
ncbi:MAG: L-seryl-tRNA(Sec) selenium transferase, partial [Deltaproteobacteria bacterium]